MKVEINEERCTGCGLCVDTCPDVFMMDDDKAIVTVDEVLEDDEEAVKEAVENCPVEAISVPEEEE